MIITRVAFGCQYGAVRGVRNASKVPIFAS